MFTCLPAYPLLTSDPYLCIWSRTDHPAASETTHWAGARKRLNIIAEVDGATVSLVGRNPYPLAELAARDVTHTTTRYTFAVGNVELALSFRAPLLLDDLDLTSTPVTFLCVNASARDGKAHAVTVTVTWHDDICRDGALPEPMIGKAYPTGDYHIAWMGKKRQPMLCHSADHITIDWGFAYLLSDTPVTFQHTRGHWCLSWMRNMQVLQPQEVSLLIGYDDVASIQYFGHIAKAWYARHGKTLPAAMKELFAAKTDVFRRMDSLDAELAEKALQAGGPDYVTLTAAAYRQTIAAHKLIADPDGNVVFLSKENDSNGCIGTVDVSYPSIPLYILYAPELVRGMCRPILKFAKMPVWQYDFAPHDVGRYPYAIGQVYGLAGNAIDTAAADPIEYGDVYPATYLYDGDENLYTLQYQMPVEESGNMILMLAATLKADGKDELIRENLPTLAKWVKYLEQYGEDPGEQLCTDDFAGHLAHNVNLAFKAVCGLAAYAYIMEHFGDTAQAEYYRGVAKRMAATIVARAANGRGTGLTMDGTGWSLKYNAVWDLLFQFGLFDKSFFTAEIQRYLDEQNAYGVPLDSRRTYTKSDWILWAATLSQAPETVAKFCAPMAAYLKETPTKIPFGDWYDTKSGAYCHFIARSVQGGIFMPMLYESWK
jgi:hypothetical protein